MAARWPLSWRPTSCPHSTAARDHCDTSAVSLLRFTFLIDSSCCAALAQPSPAVMARLGHARRWLARLMLDRSICIPRESYLRSGLFATCVHTVWRVRVRGQYKLDWGDLKGRWVRLNSVFAIFRKSFFCTPLCREIDSPPGGLNPEFFLQGVLYLDSPPGSLFYAHACLDPPYLETLFDKHPRCRLKKCPASSGWSAGNRVGSAETILTSAPPAQSKKPPQRLRLRTNLMMLGISPVGTEGTCQTGFRDFAWYA